MGEKKDWKEELKSKQPFFYVGKWGVEFEDGYVWLVKFIENLIDEALEMEAGDSNTLYEMMKKKYKAELDRAREEWVEEWEISKFVNEFWKSNDNKIAFQIIDDKVDDTELIEFTKEKLLTFSMELVSNLANQHKGNV